MAMSLTIHLHLSCLTLCSTSVWTFKPITFSFTSICPLQSVQLAFPSELCQRISTYLGSWRINLLFYFNTGSFERKSKFGTLATFGCKRYFSIQSLCNLLTNAKAYAMTGCIQSSTSAIFSLKERSKDIFLIFVTNSDTLVSNTELNFICSGRCGLVITLYYDFFIIRGKLDCIGDQVQQNLDCAQLVYL